MQWSNLRCPRSSCPDHGRRLAMDVGAHETSGELTVRHWCISCPYVEFGPSTPTAAAKTSDTVKQVRTPLRELLYRQRLEGTVIPLKRDVDAS